jgi:hypothetical protein
LDLVRVEALKALGEAGTDKCGDCSIGAQAFFGEFQPGPP